MAMAFKKTWFKHGFWNTLEHALTRVADALATIFLIRVLSPELFSKLTLAQAFVAPCLFLFISPETVIYRDYLKWEKEGAERFLIRLRALRYFAWGKGVMAIFISAIIALLFPHSAVGMSSEFRFYTFIWAFFLAIAPQMAGADREFLRLSLQLRALNWVSFFQKMTLLLGTLGVTLWFPGRIDLLAFVTVLAAIFSCLLAAGFVENYSDHLKSVQTSYRFDGSKFDLSILTLKDAVQNFSIWVHLSGVVQNWITTMDLYFLGFFRFPAREVGLYSIALKLAGFSMALPMAVSNLFSVWVGRKKELLDLKLIKKYSFWLFSITLAQGVLLILLFPWFIEIFSHGRWSTQEKDKIFTWFCWILAGGVILSSTYFVGAWWTLRGNVKSFFYKVNLTWGLLSLGIYAGAAFFGGINVVAQANLLVSAVCLFLVYKSCKT